MARRKVKYSFKYVMEKRIPALFRYALKKLHQKRITAGERQARKVLASCLQRWKHLDERSEYFSSIFNEWIEQIPDIAIAIVYHLLSLFCYYPRVTVNGIFVKLHEQLILNGNVNENNSIYISIKSKDGNSNSSNVYLLEYKTINSLSKFLTIDNITELTTDQWEHIKNIIIVDDCSGSGRTLIKFVERNVDFFKHKNIYFVTIHIMKKAKEKINQFADENYMNISVINFFEQEKALDNIYFKRNKSARELFIKTSEELGIQKDDIRGYSKAEGLFAFYNNTPNNTLGLFSCDTETYKSPFPRKHDSKPEWWHLRGGKKLKETQNYYAVKDRY